MQLLALKALPLTRFYGQILRWYLIHKHFVCVVISITCTQLPSAGPYVDWLNALVLFQPVAQASTPLMI